MKLLQWLLTFALCFFSFQSKEVPAQEYLLTQRQQHGIYKRPVEKTKEIQCANREKQTTTLKVDGIDPIANAQGTTLHARSDQLSLILLPSPLSTSLLKLEILSAKHHPPTV